MLNMWQHFNPMGLFSPCKILHSLLQVLSCATGVLLCFLFCSLLSGICCYSGENWAYVIKPNNYELLLTFRTSEGHFSH